MVDIEQEVEDRGGVIGAVELADLLDVDVRAIRDWGAEHDVSTVGRVMVFTADDAVDAADDLCGDDEGSDGDADADEEEDEACEEK